MIRVLERTASDASPVCHFDHTELWGHPAIGDESMTIDWT